MTLQELKKRTPKKYWACFDWNSVWIADGVINVALAEGYVDRLTEAHSISAENLTEWRMAITSIEREHN